MTGDDLKRMQDGFLAQAKVLLLEQSGLRPVGFVITLHKHVDKLFDSGWGVEFIDPKSCLRDPEDDNVAILIVDLAMDWKKLYHAVLNVYPQTQSLLPGLLEMGKGIVGDDAYMRVTRAFLKSAELVEKDVSSAMLCWICEKVDAFACVMQSEAWMRHTEPSEDLEQLRKIASRGLGQDQKSIEVIYSAMETHDFARMITTPIHREPSKERDDGKILGFGESTETLDTPGDGHVIEGRLARFLKPLKDAS